MRSFKIDKTIREVVDFPFYYLFIVIWHFHNIYPYVHKSKFDNSYTCYCKHIYISI